MPIRWLRLRGWVPIPVSSRSAYAAKADDMGWHITKTVVLEPIVLGCEFESGYLSLLGVIYFVIFKSNGELYIFNQCGGTMSAQHSYCRYWLVVVQSHGGVRIAFQSPSLAEIKDPERPDR
ncbi:hypothetical protein NPIL_571011 [Nephila pilipes]|uniref:Uncharacterized protein n=1 Tax=Nephila pilipes TaxID=299642 RepID=A0A8X6PY20_NEPPI|nr:hypothetical protein NPIL_571011 [Nephila pilipes]